MSANNFDDLLSEIPIKVEVREICTFKSQLMSLSEGENMETALMSRKYSVGNLAALFAKFGVTAKDTAIRAHQNNKCACFRKGSK